jgi:hypothetical protein
LIPDNIFQAHQEMYRNSRFSKDTLWDEMIDTYREKMVSVYPDILIDKCERDYHNGNFSGFARLASKIPWALRKNIRMGDFGSTARYLNLLSRLNHHGLARGPLLSLHEFLSDVRTSHENAGRLLETLEGLLAS